MPRPSERAADGIRRLMIVGCGNMGGAMLAGWLSAGLDPERFAVLDPALARTPGGVTLYRDPNDAQHAAAHDTVLLGFKPQQLADLADGLQSLAGEGVTVHSLLAGITLDQLRVRFPLARAYVRVMPNLAARIGKSPVILLQHGLDTAQCELVRRFYAPLGAATWLDAEAQFDLATALAGSGPGFVYRFIDALAQAAADLGLERGTADRLALTMVEGAASLAASADALPATLADQVASAGGMTREGLNVLDENEALVRLLTDTLAATRDRGAELAADMASNRR